jgi:osmotically inducible protein OsmC
MATRNGSAEWKGSVQDGTGSVTVGDDVYTGNYSFKSRFEDEQGTNPEELLAAAHAACFSMALSMILSQEGNAPESINTSARAELRNVDGKPTITKMHLETEGRVPGIDEDAFKDAAEKAKGGCVISRAVAGVGEITLDAKLAT